MLTVCTLFGETTFPVHRVMSITQSGRAEKVLSGPCGPTSYHGQALGLPGVPVTCLHDSKATAYSFHLAEEPQDAFAQVPTQYF